MSLQKQEDKKVDLLHPLVMSSMKWEILCKDLPIGMKDSQAVWFKGKLYLGGGTTTSQADSVKLYIYSPDTNTWGSMNTPVSHFALAVYQSQIVLVGGKKYGGENSSQMTNNVRVMTDELNSQWKMDIIPHMSFQRSGAVAVSIDSTLIVTGGEHELSALNIEIYDGRVWQNIDRPSDLRGSDVKMVLHEFDCYFFGGRHGRSVFSANLSSLITSCKMGGDCEEDLWRQVPDIPEQVAGGCPTVFGCRLVVENGGILYAYSPNTQVWVHMPKMPNEDVYNACIVCSNRELMVIGGLSAKTNVVSKQVAKVSINYPVYNPNENFTFESLSLLQSEADIPLLHELEKKKLDLLRIIRVRQTSTLEDALKQWIAKGVQSHIKPTWKSIRLLLCLLHLDELEKLVGRVLENSANMSTQCNIIYQEVACVNDIQRSHHGTNAVCVSNPDCEIEYKYCARVFFIHQKIATYEIHFIITRDTSDHVSAIIEEYARKGAHSGPYQLVRFEDNAISLSVRELETKKWKVTPQSPPIITKQQVNMFERGKTIPGCQLLAQFLDQVKDVPDVHCRIHLCGAKPPHDYFIINLPVTDHEYVLPLKRRFSMSETEQSSAKRKRLDELTPTIEAGVPLLKDLLKEFYTNAKLWEDLGIQLGINDAQLIHIKSDNTGDSKGCLREMFREWLKSIEPLPSWPAVVNALENLRSDPSFVQNLKSKYC